MQDIDKTKEQLISELTEMRQRIDVLEASESEWRQAEKELQGNYEDFQGIFENLNDVIIRLDKYGKIVEVNGRLKNMFGYEPDEIIGKNFTKFNLFSMKELSKMVKLFADGIRGKVTRFTEVAIRRKDGSTFFSEISTGLAKRDNKIEGMIAVVRDITERKQTEEALRESEERYRALLELGGEVGEAIVMLQDTEQGEGIQTFVSDAWLRITGYSRKGLLGMSFFDLIHPKYYEASLKRHHRKISGEIIPGLFEILIIRKDGTEVPIELTSAYATYQGQHANVAFIRDITERKQAEEALRKSEEKWRSLVENATNLIMLTDCDCKIQFINRTVAGISANDVIGKSIYDYILPGYHDTVRKVVKRVLESGKTDRYEIKGSGPDGSTSWYETMISPVKSAGEVVGMIHIISDITERRRTERELQERLKELQCLYGIANIAEKRGITLDEIYQETANLLPAGWQYPEVACARIALGNKEFKTDNFKATEWKQSANISVGERKEGTVEVCYLEARPEIDEGPFQKEERQLIDAVAERLGRITERIYAQHELREKNEQLDAQNEELQSQSEELMVKQQGLIGKTKELEEANVHLQEVDHLKSIFLASMSHELRTPLNSIIGFTSLILQGMVGEINEEQRNQLTYVNSSANHLLSLINDILDISKIEAGKIELELEEFRLGDVATEVVETLSPTAKLKGIRLLTEISEDITLFSDRRRLKQALMNLVSNAVKFTDRGSVKVASRIPADDNLEISVIDTGIGIKKEDMGKLFVPFHQVDESLTKKHAGTGLGLYITRKILTLLGGNISAKSNYGKGSEFSFTLPIKYRVVTKK